ncbi:putative lipase ROG1 [Colletotrichum chlorophyti]|uniref:Putative lipase ROG1 n=1 Tax=Colletotrichum chlorophyti TaxID=708187 RepID=A0A1Q8S8D3_9PEZI|nr:putative lipase ROG1 [Colletotrichum chlorophyti]
MLLVYQVGSVKIGEVVRYTVTYTPSQDRILPSPERLYLRVRNTSAIALRAAFVHGPYTLSAAAYPSNFNPNVKFANPRRYGVPEFEPMLKAGGSWECELVVPEHIRQSAGTGGGAHFGGGPQEGQDPESASWIVEVSSQVIFSTSAAVGYEVTLARDQKSLNLSSSLPVIGGQAQVPQPGKVADHQQSIGAKDGHHPAQPKGIFSKAIRLKVEDTAALWNTPRLPGWDDLNIDRLKGRTKKDQPVESVTQETAEEKKPEHKQKKVHLVVLTHGLHSNLGADMLYLKESIDATVAQAKIDAKARRAKERAERNTKDETHGGASNGVTEDDSPAEDHGDDEEVIVRGFSGNATRTERGIKYLGKRLARYILSMTYPDQPFLPSRKGHAESAVTSVFNKSEPDSKAVHKHSTIHKEEVEEKRPFKITSISFIGHSLGGLIQTYAVAYIQKHSPEFFTLIKPINFVALATPFLGLSNENPLYVKFALDFGLVGRTGQDLGLTWRAPTIARSGWGAIVSNLGESAHKRVMGEVQPESKPLLRILPTGPAHTALKKFRNRTVYSNVVNDGIVPLRTSCLLFLDWQGLGRVEKARRDAGLVETLVGAGWAELTGSSLAPTPRRTSALPPENEQTPDDHSGNITPTAPSNAVEVPQPPQNAMMEDDRASLRSVPTPYDENGNEAAKGDGAHAGPFAGFFSLFKSSEPTQPKTPGMSNKQHKIYKRSQTINFDEISQQPSGGSKVTAGHELERGANQHIAPPRTSFFESAHDLINPKIPTTEYIIDPTKRPRTIFHDRVYHPADIPPPPLKKKPTGSLASRRNTFRRAASAGSGGSRTSTDSSPHASHRFSHEDTIDSTRDYDDTANTNPDKGPDEEIDGSQMRVEEKIARAYHRGLAWRKVLVKLEPDAHNNIIVRRMFANAYGWPVVKHLVDAHFSDSATARTRDDQEKSGERAFDIRKPPNKFGDEVRDSGARTPKDGPSDRATAGLLSPNSQREAEDMVPDMQPQPKRRSSSRSSSASPPRITRSTRPQPERVDSMTWSDRDWADSDDSETTATTASAVSPRDPEFKDKDGNRFSAPWNWTEKIVGRGSARKTLPKMKTDVVSPKTSPKSSPRTDATPDIKADTNTSNMSDDANKPYKPDPKTVASDIPTTQTNPKTETKTDAKTSSETDRKASDMKPGEGSRSIEG